MKLKKNKKKRFHSMWPYIPSWQETRIIGYNKLND